MSPRVCPSEVYDDPNVGTVWELLCRVPYCSMQYAQSAGSIMHRMAACPIMQTVVATYGEQDGKSGPLKGNMYCLACRCGAGTLDEGSVRGCEHCLNICYCPFRVFEEVGTRVDREGHRLEREGLDKEKVSSMS